MSSKTLGNLIKISVLAITVCGLFLILLIIPSFGNSIIEANPEFRGWFWPWLIFAWIFSIPCFAILVCVWKVSVFVASENVFTLQTAKWVKTGAMLLLSDAVFLFLGNVVLFLCNMNHPGVLLMSIIADIFAVALALFMAILSRYLTKAAVMQDECEGTL